MTTSRPHLDAALDAHRDLTAALETYTHRPNRQARKAVVCAALLVAEKMMADGREMRQEPVRAPTWAE